MLTPTLTRFLTEIASLIKGRNAQEIGAFLVIEPPYSTIYEQLRNEIRASYSAQDGTSLSRLEAACLEKLAAVLNDPEGQVPTWTAFNKFIAQYFIFLRDIDIGNLLATYELLSELLQKANSALTHAASGVLLLPTVVSYSKMLSRLAIGLDKQPHLIAHLRPASSDDSGTRETLPERAANTLRQAFVTCLNDRSGTSASGLDAAGQPQGKKRGIYTIANLCLKILFQCRKIRGAAQIFENIYNQSPPLAAFPKAQRVTYLYYLGRFSFANGHFGRAARALQRSWDECHVQAAQQLRLITIYLVAANMVCGRFPTPSVMARCPDLAGRYFEPLCRAIRAGDLVVFRRLLDPDGDASLYAFFARYRIDLPLRNRCEVYVWRSAARRCFLLSGNPGDPAAKKAPTLDLAGLLAIWSWQEREYLAQSGGGGYVDPDFEGLPAQPARDNHEASSSSSFDMMHVVSRLSSLIHQDFVNGYISYKLQKLAIQGARAAKGGAVAAGFPNIWQAVSARGDDEVPGWKLEIKSGGAFARGGGQFGPGQVVNLSGARPVGVN